MEDLTVVNVLLGEFRAFRDVEFRQFRDEQTDLRARVAALEITIKPVVIGNGQPSELASIKSRISDLESIRWRAIGAVGTICMVISMLFSIGTLWLKKTMGW